jgi:hypothetical protein
MHFLKVFKKNCFDPSCLAIDVQLITLLVVIALCKLVYYLYRILNILHKRKGKLFY